MHQKVKLNYAEIVHMEAIGLTPRQIAKHVRTDVSRIKELLNRPSEEDAARVWSLWRGHWDSKTIATETGLAEEVVLEIIHAQMDARHRRRSV
jgi:hypothetical protein